jgi:hypothetical protein
VQADRAALERAAVQAAQLSGVTPCEAPPSVPFVVAAELGARCRIIACFGSVAHGSQCGVGEELELPHDYIIPHPARRHIRIDHANPSAMRGGIPGRN